MRFGLAVATASAMLAAGFVASPTYATAAPAPVGAVTVTPSMDNQGVAYATVSWASEDPHADGVLVCVRPGTTPAATPRRCESQINVIAPNRSSVPIPLSPAKNYTFNVFSYKGTSPITYGQPVSVMRHGTKLAFQNSCGAQAVGQSCRINGTLSDTFRHVGLAHRTVELWRSRSAKPTAWSLVARVRTHAGGAAHAVVTLDRTRLYQWRYAATRLHELPSSSTRYEIVVSH